MRAAPLAFSLLLLLASSTWSQEIPKAGTTTWEWSSGEELPQAVRVDLRGAPLWVALKSGGVAALAPSGTSVRIVSRIPSAHLGGLDAMHFDQRGTLLYVALGDLFAAQGAHAGLAIVDVTRPESPRVLGVWRSEQPQQGSAAVLVTGRHAYLGAMSHGVQVIDIGVPTSPRLVITFLPDIHFPRRNPGKVQHPNARGFAMSGKHLVVAFDAGGLRVLDVDEPSRPRELGRHVNAGLGNKQQAYNNLVVDGDLAFVAVDYAGLEVVDLSDPAAPRTVGWWNPWGAETLRNLWLNSPGHTNQVAYDARSRRVYLSAGDSELQVVDVSQPRRPKLVAHHGAPKNGRGAWGLTLDGDQVYLGYIRAAIPFRGTWSGVLALRLGAGPQGARGVR